MGEADNTALVLRYFDSFAAGDAEADMASPRLTIDVWADVLCPWCYVGEHRLSTAVAQSLYAADIDLKIHTWQLDPNVPTEVSWIPEYRVKKFGVTPDQARAMENEVAGQAAADGLPYVFDRPVRNTLDMLRLVHLGNEHGVGWQYMAAMHAQLFGSGNADTLEHRTLIRLGEGLGIPVDQFATSWRPTATPPQYRPITPPRWPWAPAVCPSPSSATGSAYPARPVSASTPTPSTRHGSWSMPDTPPSAQLQLIDTGPVGGWCDAETGICTSTVPEPDASALASLGESPPGADQADCLPG